VVASNDLPTPSTTAVPPSPIERYQHASWPKVNSKFAQAIAVISTVTPLYHKWHSLRVFFGYSRSIWIRKKTTTRCLGHEGWSKHQVFFADIRFDPPVRFCAETHLASSKPFSGAWKNQQVTDCSKQDNFDTLRSLSCISLLSEAFSKLYTSCQVLLAISASCPHHLTFLGLLPLLHQMLDHLNSLSGGDGNRD
jgi:hypothetical protein